MDQGTIQILFALLRSAICGTKLTEAERAQCTEECIRQLGEVSAKHDLAHLIALGLKQNKLPFSNRAIFNAVYRYEQLNYEYGKLCDAFEAAKIPFMPLKGSVLRKYYPEEWMRTSCDIDILVREEDSQKAQSVLVDQFGYTCQGTGSHDISLFAPSGVHVELHYALVEDGIANESSSVLNCVWETANMRSGFTCWNEMPDEMFYFYHVAHMAKHFENGGCGIRPLIDLWILDNLENADQSARDKLLEQGKLLKFAQSARKLSKVWLDGMPKDSISQQMEDYILFGGVYGNNENRIMVHQQKKGGRLQYALSKIILPYECIKFYYPVLQKHRWLTPVMQVRRWCKLIFCGHLKRTTKELAYNSKISDAKAADIQLFLDNIGISRK